MTHLQCKTKKPGVRCEDLDRDAEQAAQFLFAHGRADGFMARTPQLFSEAREELLRKGPQEVIFVLEVLVEGRVCDTNRPGYGARRDSLLAARDQHPVRRLEKACPGHKFGFFARQAVGVSGVGAGSGFPAPLVSQLHRE